jgi:hypothetical protein
MGGLIKGLVRSSDIADSAVTYTKVSGNSMDNSKLSPSAEIAFSKLNSGATEANNVQKRAAKAWANFNGSSGVANAAFNIASITKNGTGDYTLNFTAAMADGNYCVQITTNGVSNGMQYGGSIHSSAYGSAPTLKTASALRINVGSTYGGTAVDVENINVLILGN